MPTQLKEVRSSVTALHAGEEGEGPLESRDLYVVGPGFSLLVNATVEGVVTYSAHSEHCKTVWED